LAESGTFQLLVAAPWASQLRGWGYSVPLSPWRMTRRVGSSSAAGMAKPRLLRLRARCFMERVWPGRKRVRSSTEWILKSPLSPQVATPKRQGSMPSFQSERTKL